jgi:hypothetical protein
MYIKRALLSPDVNLRKLTDTHLYNMMVQISKLIKDETKRRIVGESKKKEYIAQAFLDNFVQVRKETKFNDLGIIGDDEVALYKFLTKKKVNNMTKKTEDSIIIPHRTIEDRLESIEKKIAEIDDNIKIIVDLVSDMGDEDTDEEGE